MCRRASAHRSRREEVVDDGPKPRPHGESDPIDLRHCRKAETPVWGLNGGLQLCSPQTELCCWHPVMRLLGGIDPGSRPCIRIAPRSITVPFETRGGETFIALSSPTTSKSVAPVKASVMACEPSVGGRSMIDGDFGGSGTGRGCMAPVADSGSGRLDPMPVGGHDIHGVNRASNRLERSGRGQKWETLMRKRFTGSKSRCARPASGGEAWHAESGMA